MIGRGDQQVRVTELMIQAMTWARWPPSTRSWQVHVQLPVHDDGHLLHLPHHGRPARGPGQEDPAGEYLRTVDPAVYGKMRRRPLPSFTDLPGQPGRKLSVSLYRLARKIYKFN